MRTAKLKIAVWKSSFCQRLDDFSQEIVFKEPRLFTGALVFCGFGIRIKGGHPLFERRIMSKYSLIGLSGSLRADSTNSKLLAEAARLFEAKEFTLADLRLPLYDGDLESKEGVPEAVQALSESIAKADAVLISTPEYNKAPSGVLKNALDWVSRTKLKPWNGKPLAVMSASSGRAGGERAQSVLRGFMVPFRPRILQGPEIHLADSSNQFDGKGHLTGDLYVRELTVLMRALRDEIGR